MYLFIITVYLFCIYLLLLWLYLLTYNHNLKCGSLTMQINDIDVVKVTRRGATAVHLVIDAVTVDTDAVVTLDWTRRWDHMQQHSGE